MIGQAYEVGSVEWAQSVLKLSEDDTTKIIMEEKGWDEEQARTKAKEILKYAQEIVTGKLGKRPLAPFLLIGMLLMVGFVSYRIRQRTS